MNNITYAVSVDVTNPIIPYNVYVASVLDSNVRYLEITLYQNGNVIVLSNAATATASLVTDGVLIDDSVNCTISNNIITVPLEDLQRHGNLDVQVSVTEGTKVLAIPFPIQVRVTPNIAENAQIDENSLGSYAEVVHEIAEARGTYTTLRDAISAKLSATPGAVGTENLANESITVEKVADDLAAVINAKEVKSNKKTTITGNESSNDFYPTTKAVYDYVASTGLTENFKQALLNCFQNVAWINNRGLTLYQALYNALYPSDNEIVIVIDGTSIIWELGYVAADGNVTQELMQPGAYTSDFVFVGRKSHAVLALDGAQALRLAFYDSFKTFISYVLVGEADVPANAAYLRATIAKKSIGNNGYNGTGTTITLS